MKKMKKRGWIVCVMLLLTAFCCSLTANAKEGGIVYRFTGENDPFVSENAGIFPVAYDAGEDALKLVTLSWGWTDGCNIIRNYDEPLKVSPTENKFMKVYIKGDADAADQEKTWSKCSFFLSSQESGSDYEVALRDQTISITEEYTSFIVDFGLESELSCRRLRLDFNCAEAKNYQDVQTCGTLYIKAIALFDTKAEAEQFDLFAPAPTTPPETTVPPTEDNQPTGDGTAYLTFSAAVLAAGVCLLRVKKQKSEC